MVNVQDDELRDAMVEAGAGQIVGLGAYSDAYQCIRAALAAAEQLGYVLVPIAPTPAMVKSVETGRVDMSIDTGWRTMVAARPLVTLKAEGSRDE